MEIPRIVVQTWKTDKVPEHWKESQVSWESLREHGWEYKLWTDADIDAFVAKEYAWFIDQFRAYPRGVQRADCFRYFILHHQGGLYVDLDIVCKPKEFLNFFDLVKQHKVVLPHTKDGNGHGDQCLSNCMMLSQKGAEFWPHVWARLQHPYKNRPFKALAAKMTPYFGTLFTTGPGVVSDAFAMLKDKSGVYIAPSAILQPGNDNLPKPHDGTESVVRVIEGNSWHPKDAKFWKGLTWFAKHRDKIMGTLIGLMLAVIIALSVWISVLRR